MIVGAVLLAAIAFITMLGESLSPKQKTQLTAASMGGAAGLLVGYGVGRIKPDPARQGQAGWCPEYGRTEK